MRNKFILTALLLCVTAFTALAQKLLGRSWDELLPLFLKGREAYEAALKAAPTASEEAVENMADLDARMKELEASCLDRPSRTLLTSESGKNRMTHIVRDPETNRIRKLTPVECERLDGFPDNWTNTGMSEKFRYFCMGNALVVGLIEKMGHQIQRLNK